MKAEEWESARTQHNCQSKKPKKRQTQDLLLLLLSSIAYRISSIARVTYCLLLWLLLYNLNLLWFYFWSNDSHSIALFKPKIFPIILHSSLSLSLFLTTVFLCLCSAFNGSAFSSFPCFFCFFSSFICRDFQEMRSSQKVFAFYSLISFTWLPQDHFGIRSIDRQRVGIRGRGLRVYA